MGKKAFNPTEDPPTASSSDQEEIEQISPKEPTTVNATAKHLVFDSDSDEPEVPLNRRSGKAIALTPLKRRSEGTSRNVPAKRAQTGTNTSVRVSWCDDDETTLLKGMIDFHDEKGMNPDEHRDSFFEFVKEKFSRKYTKTKAIEKIRSLKRKYIVEGGKRVNQSSFSKPHDKECLRLAKCIWGSDGTVLLTSIESKNGRSEANEEEEEEKKKKKKKKKVVQEEEQDEEILVDKEVEERGEAVEERGENLALGGGQHWFEKSVLVKCMAMFGVEEHIAKERWSSYPAEIKKQLGERWNSLESKGFEVVSLKCTFLSELASMLGKGI